MNNTHILLGEKSIRFQVRFISGFYSLRLNLPMTNSNIPPLSYNLSYTRVEFRFTAYYIHLQYLHIHE